MIGATLAVTILTLAGCSGGEDGDTNDGGSGASAEAVDSVDTEALLGKVRGDLDQATADAALAEVSAVVDGWIDNAYGGDYPRSDFGAAYASFTPDAQALATEKGAVLSNAALGADLSGVRITQRRIDVDLLGVKGKAAAATARVDVGLELEGADESAQSDVVGGRLFLTRGKDGWQVFGFDVNRGQEGA